jgi:hypothetical protein
MRTGCLSAAPQRFVIGSNGFAPSPASKCRSGRYSSRMPAGSTLVDGLHVSRLAYAFEDAGQSDKWSCIIVLCL